MTSFLQKEIKEADVDHNGLVDFQEFQNYFQKLARMQQNEARLQKLRANRKNIPAGLFIKSLQDRWQCSVHFCTVCSLSVDIRLARWCLT